MLADLPYSLLGVPSLSVASEGRSRGSSFRSLSEVAALSSARSSAALMSLRRESSGLLSCPVIIGSWRELGAQVGNREEGKKREKHPWLDVLLRLTLTGSFSMSLLTLSTQLLLSIAHSSLSLSLSLLLPPSPALSFICGWCYPADTAGCCLVKNCYGSRGFTIIPCSPKTVIHPSPRAHYYLTCASSSANTKLTAVYKEDHWLCADK